MLLRQFLDHYVDPKNAYFTRWFFWDYMEYGFSTGELKLGRVDVIGGLDEVQEGLDKMYEGKWAERSSPFSRRENNVIHHENQHVIAGS